MKLLAINGGVCEQVSLLAYPKLIEGNGSVTVTKSTDADGAATYKVELPTAGEATLVADGANLKFTNAEGSVTSIPVCDLLKAIPDSGALVGG